MHVFLETDRLILRRFTEADVDLLHDLDSDPEVLRYVTGGPPTPREEIRDDILPAFLGYYARFAGYGFWAALERSSGTFLGWFHFRPLPGSPPDEPELGYRLRRAAWDLCVCGPLFRPSFFRRPASLRLCGAPLSSCRSVTTRPPRAFP